jgi:hypothetical protein
VEYIDPCGTLAGSYNEVLMKTKSGKVIAYFESGGNRFLTILKPNTLYSTTDNQHCKFKIDNSGLITEQYL